MSCKVRPVAQRCSANKCKSFSCNSGDGIQILRKEKLLICGQLRNLRLKFLVTVSMKFDFQNLFGYTKIAPWKILPRKIAP